MRSTILVFSLLVTFLLVAPSAQAEETPREVGQAAFDRGDFDAALTAWKPLLPKKDAHIQFSVGRILLVQGGESEIARGLSLIRASARAGHIPALEFMAQSTILGMYTPQDIDSCARYLRDVERASRSRQNRHAIEAATALLLLSNFYKFGMGSVPKDHDRSIALLKRAADMGDPVAQCYYGLWMNVEGEGKRRDRVEAHKWFVLSWKQNGGIWKPGDLGTPKKFVSARGGALYTRGKMSPAEFERSKTRVRAWMDAKARGEVGHAFDPDKQRSLGERALKELEESHRDMAAGMSSMDYELQMPCVPMSSKAKRECVQGYVLHRTKRKVETRSRSIEYWTYVSGQTRRVYPVVFTRKAGGGTRWTIQSPIPGA